MKVERSWIVPATHPAFAGHFPGHPILPGVVLIDQALRLADGLLPPGSTVRGLGNAKFFQPVAPGATLTFHYAQATATALGFEVRHGEQLVASGSLSLGPGS